MGIEVHSEGIDKSIVQLEKSLGGLVDQAGQYVARKLQELMIKRYGASGIKNRTGALKDSLVVHYDPKTNQIYLAIKIYGVFLSYGVGPRVRKGKVYNIDDWVLKSLSGKPRKGTQFAYDETYRKYGIPSRKFIPGNDAIEAIFADFVKEANLDILKQAKS